MVKALLELEMERYQKNKVEDLIDLVMNLKSKYGILMPPHPLTYFQIQKYYQNKPRFNGIYSRDNLPNKTMDGAYVINLDEYSDIGSHWIALYSLNNDVTYFNSFGVEIFQKKLKNLLEIKTWKQIFLEYKHMIQ